MTIQIDHIRLRLPQGFESRAQTIAHEIGAGLNQQNWSRDIHIDQLSVPPVSISPDEGDSALAQKVVAAIVQGIEGRLR